MGTKKGSSTFFKIKVELKQRVLKNYIGGNMDRRPLLLVPTASTSVIHNVFTHCKGGRTTIEAPTYKFSQPVNIHALF
jgi:hypothetical protein